MTNNEESFIKELESLTRKYNVAIAGCGCCGSPFLIDLDKEAMHNEAGYAYVDNIVWVSKQDEYDWETLSKDIIKNEVEE